MAKIDWKSLLIFPLIVAIFGLIVEYGFLQGSKLPSSGTIPNLNDTSLVEKVIFGAIIIGWHFFLLPLFLVVGVLVLAPMTGLLKSSIEQIEIWWEFKKLEKLENKPLEYIVEFLDEDNYKGNNLSDFFEFLFECILIYIGIMIALYFLSKINFIPANLALSKTEELVTNYYHTAQEKGLFGNIIGYYLLYVPLSLFVGLINIGLKFFK